MGLGVSTHRTVATPPTHHRHTEADTGRGVGASVVMMYPIIILGVDICFGLEQHTVERTRNQSGSKSDVSSSATHAKISKHQSDIICKWRTHRTADNATHRPVA